MINFVAAVGIGLVIGLVGGFALRDKHANAIWLAPVLAVAGAVFASVLAAIFGDPQYGWKEPILQVVLALAGVGVVGYLATRGSAAKTGATADN